MGMDSDQASMWNIQDKWPNVFDGAESERWRKYSRSKF